MTQNLGLVGCVVWLDGFGTGGVVVRAEQPVTLPGLGTFTCGQVLVYTNDGRLVSVDASEIEDGRRSYVMAHPHDARSAETLVEHKRQDRFEALCEDPAAVRRFEQSDDWTAIIGF